MSSDTKHKAWIFRALALILFIIIAVGSIVIPVIIIKKNKSTEICQYESYASDTCSDHCTKEYSVYIEYIFNQSIHWNQTTAQHYLKTFHSTPLGQCIVNILPYTDCELRPNPTCYIPQNVIGFHLESYYRFGASSIDSTYYASLDSFDTIGYPPNEYDSKGIQWVSPYPAQTALLNNCSSQTYPSNCVLTALGINISANDMFRYDWGHPTVINRVMQVHVFNDSLAELHLRLPSGNEQGTDSFWRPGGYTINGVSEAVVDEIATCEYCWNAVSDANGTFCYDNCDVVCDGESGCSQNHCQSA